MQMTFLTAGACLVEIEGIAGSGQASCGRTVRVNRTRPVARYLLAPAATGSDVFPLDAGMA